MRVVLVLCVALALCTAVVLAAPIPSQFWGDYYSANCETSPFGVGNYGKRYVKLTAGFWTLHYDFYLGDNTCTNLDVSMDILGWAAAYTGAPSTVSDATPVDLQIGQRFVLPASYAGFQYLNATCGPSLFQHHFSRDSSQINCPAFGLVPLNQCGVEYEIIRFASTGQLQFGVVSPAVCSPLTRPTAWMPETLTQVLPYMPSPRGVYSTGCIVGEHGGSSYKIDSDFTDIYYDVVATGYADTTCTTTFSEFFTRGTYQMFRPSPTVANAYYIDITSMDKRLLLANNAANATGYYQRMCPNNTFTPEVYMDIRFYDCPMFDFIDDRRCPIRYELIEITSTQIRFGAPNDLVHYDNTCQQANRPTTLGPLVLKNVNAPALDPIAAGVIIAAIAFVVGAAVFGIICGCCCARRAARGSDNAYSEPLTSR